MTQLKPNNYTNNSTLLQGDIDEEAAALARAKKSFKKFTYRGVDLDQLLDMSTEQVGYLLLLHAYLFCCLLFLF